jgi:hypothetical protein
MRPCGALNTKGCQKDAYGSATSNAVSNDLVKGFILHFASYKQSRSAYDQAPYSVDGLRKISAIPGTPSLSPVPICYKPDANLEWWRNDCAITVLSAKSKPVPTSPSSTKVYEQIY